MSSTIPFPTDAEIRTALIAARERISEPEHWTQGRSARNAAGHAVRHDSPDAESYCMLGAVAWASDWTTGSDTETLKLYNQAVGALRGGDPSLVLAAFNDTHTHAEVLDLFDRAIARLHIPTLQGGGSL